MKIVFVKYKIFLRELIARLVKKDIAFSYLSHNFIRYSKDDEVAVESALQLLYREQYSGEQDDYYKIMEIRDA